MGYVGSRMRRLEDPQAASAVGLFAGDEERPGQLWMCVVRSPVAMRFWVRSTQATAWLPITTERACWLVAASSGVRAARQTIRPG